ncbi:MAG: hypothetical protein HC869_05695 [Rhodospirillales bacterium]|nr:hypothetical protein [Rhodospirillales bacterium]
MLAYHVEWHRRRKLASVLYDETDREAAGKCCGSRRTEDGLPVLSFQGLLAELATLTRNITATRLNDEHELILYARPTPIQTKAFDLLGVKPERTQQSPLPDAQKRARSISCAFIQYRGRDAHCWARPAQIPASGTTAPGFCLECLAAKRIFGQG